MVPRVTRSKSYEENLYCIFFPGMWTLTQVTVLPVRKVSSFLKWPKRLCTCPQMGFCQHSYRYLDMTQDSVEGVWLVESLVHAASTAVVRAREDSASDLWPTALSRWQEDWRETGRLWERGIRVKGNSVQSDFLTERTFNDKDIVATLSFWLWRNGNNLHP